MRLKHIAGLQAMRISLTAALMIPPAMLIFGALVLWQSAWHAAWDDLHWKVIAAHENASRNFENRLLALRRVEELSYGLSDAQITRHEPELHATLADLSFPHEDDLFIVSAAGDLLVTAHRAQQNIADRDFFHRLQATDDVVVSERLISRVTGQPMFVMAQRRLDRDGHFAGAVGVTVPINKLELNYLETPLARNDFDTALMLIRSDGIWLVRSPAPAAGYPSDGVPRSIVQAMARANSGHLLAESRIRGGAMTLLTYRKIADLPIFVAASLPRSAVAMRWIETLVPHLYFGVPAYICLVLVTIVAIRRTQTVLATAQAYTEEQQHRKTAERVATAAQKMEAVGGLVSGVAHDFNNTLAIIVGQGELALKAPERAPTALRHIVDAAQKSSYLIKQLTTFVRTDPIDPKVIDVNAEVQRMAVVLQSALGGLSTLDIQPSPRSCRIKVDPVELEMALLNLAVNARDAMPKGGELEMAIECGRETVELRVCDTGQGMSQEVAERAFDPFFTTKAAGKGTGLGLSQVATFTRKYGGHASIVSEPGRGTCVSLWLPLTSEPLLPGPTGEECVVADATAVRAFKVLLVEDDAAVAEVVAIMLSSDFDCEIVCKSTAVAALAAMETGEADPDLIVSDIRMPGGQSGLDLARVLRRRWPEKKLILMTGYSEQTIGPEYTVLRKPIDRRSLVEAVTRVIQQTEATEDDR